MKRSSLSPSGKPLTRKKPMNRGKGFQRNASGVLRVVAVDKSRQPKLPKMITKAQAGAATVFRSEAYLAAVRLLPCVHCGCVHGIEAAHSNQLFYGKGGRIKGSDAAAMALCGTMPGRVGCHGLHDQGGIRSKADWKAFENACICKTILGLIVDGRLVSDIDTMVRILNLKTESYDEAAPFLVHLVETKKLQVVRR